jgi:two-component system, OmpR family, phosphate regulon sensor histidine kinase PhoR
MDASMLVVVVILCAVIGLLWLRLRDRAQQVSSFKRDLAASRLELADIQARLQTAYSAMSRLADASSDALLVVDTERRIWLINQAARDVFAVKEQTTGQTLMSVTRNHELDAIVQDVLRGEAMLDSQLELQERSFRVHSALIDLSGKHNVVLALQDVTELLRLTRARREMVANFSHDLRTPISSIRLLVDTLLQNFGKNSERDTRLLGKIAGETDSLQHITQELIDLSMIESGKAIIRMIPVPFSEIVRDALNIMSTQLEQKKLEIINEVPNDIRVLVDPEQTRRVITNLLHNSVKFTPSRGTIRFEMSTDAQVATVRVSDTGPGIPPQDRTRVFERFYQVDMARTGQTGGSGLGLSIAKHIIEAQGGKIWAEAGIPVGATICFTLPLVDSLEPAT